MSREEAARTYLDGLLGFRGDFRLFQRATDVLSEQEQSDIETAVAVRMPDGNVSREHNSAFSRSHNENENQYL